MTTPAREPNAEHTPEQWVEMFLGHAHSEQVNIAENALRWSRESLTCFIANHAARIRSLEATIGELREEHAKAVEALVVDLERGDPYTEAVRDAAFVIRNPGHRPPGWL